ncbi:hypothetical protein OEB99_11200 [Actinotalea sp. M2MS4P-6]|uniref:hypothetical protein n=1 Tax=Actinotalea sp. M2MS4P-6 TaxID=2983762 RepID=UPI0021E48D30|nr:hypothetical protein [Actinotalea sp. M2MS4P-6]MCV2394877.1 hypothetical protein [Actinotalea sp. M2MS4P-6]
MDLPAALADPGAAVRRVLDPVLVPRGFAAGQVGRSGREVEITFCAPARVIRDRFGGLAVRAADGPEPEPWECHDLVVVVGLEADGAAYLDQVRLDSQGLDRLLRSVDRDDLAPEAVGLDRPRDPGDLGPSASVLVSGAVDYEPRDLDAIGPVGPLGRLPLDAALARAAELLDVVLGEAERHPVWWDSADPWTGG